MATGVSRKPGEWGRGWRAGGASRRMAIGTPVAVLILSPDQRVTIHVHGG